MERKTALKRWVLAALAAVMLFCTCSIMALADNLTVPDSERVYEPVILSQITPKTLKVKVYGYEDTTLYVKKGKKLITKKVFKKDGIKNIQIKRQKKGTKLSFKLVNNRNNKARTVYQAVGKKNKDLKTRKQRAAYKYGYLTVKGTVGSTVYLKAVEKGKADRWRKIGVILDKNGVSVKPGIAPSSKKKSYCWIKLKDADGKFGKAMKVYIKPEKIMMEISK